MNGTASSFALVLTLVGTCACKRSAPPQAAAPADTNDMTISLKDFQGLHWMEVPVPTDEGAWMPGEASGDEASRAVLTSPVKGIVAGPPATPGRPVPKGVLLLTLQSPEIAELKSRWLAAKARLERAEADLAREQRLAEGNATSRRDLEAARSEAATAQAEAESARLGLEARGLRPQDAGTTFLLKAPTAGSVQAWKVQMGQGVEAGQELGTFQASAATLMMIELPMPAPSWRLGDRTLVRDAQGHQWKGLVEGLPTALGSDTRRLAFRLRLSGGPLPLPGTSLEAKVPTGSAIGLPDEALQQIEGEWGVFVKAGDKASFRPVRRGRSTSGKVQVLEGLRPGESIVDQGAYLLKSQILKRRSGGEDA